MKIYVFNYLRFFKIIHYYFTARIMLDIDFKNLNGQHVLNHGIRLSAPIFGVLE